MNGVSVFETNKKLSELMPPGGESLMIGLRRPPPEASPTSANAAAEGEDATSEQWEEVTMDEAEAAEEAERVAAARSAFLEEGYAPAMTVVLLRPDRSVSLGVNVEYMETHGLPEITRLAAGGIAEKTGSMRIGDVITAVNGVETARGPDALVAALGQAQGEVELLVRVQRGADAPVAASPPVAAPETPSTDNRPSPWRVSKTPPAGAPPLPTPLPSSAVHSTQAETYLSPVKPPTAEPPAGSSIVSSIVSTIAAAPAPAASAPRSSPSPEAVAAASAVVQSAVGNALSVAAAEAKPTVTTPSFPPPPQRISFSKQAAGESAAPAAQPAVGKGGPPTMPGRRVRDSWGKSSFGRRDIDSWGKGGDMPPAPSEPAPPPPPPRRAAAAPPAAPQSPPQPAPPPPPPRRAPPPPAVSAAPKPFARSLTIILDAEDSDTSYSSMMAAGKAANDRGDIARARELFVECFELSGRVQAGISASNMALKLGDVAKACDEYAGLLERYGNMMPEELTHHVKSKLASAKNMLLRDMPADPSMGAAVRMQMLRGDTMRAITSGSSPESPEDRYREILSRAIKENSEGRFGKARELFFRLYELKGHYETRLSAANMTLKLGESHAALVEYLTIAEHREDLSERGQATLDDKLEEARRRSAVEPRADVEKRMLRVREETADGIVRWDVQFVAVGGGSVAPTVAPLSPAPAAVAPANDPFSPSASEEDVAAALANASIEIALFDLLEPTDQAEVVTLMAVEEALSLHAPVSSASVTPARRVAEGDDEWVFVESEEVSQASPEHDAATRLQSSLRGRVARAQVDLTKSYIECLQAGQAANKAGEYERARELFLAAYEMTGRAEPRISATNMRLKLFEVPQAIAEYEELLEHNNNSPGFLSPTAIGVVQRKIVDARELFVLMSRNAEGTNGGEVGEMASGPPDFLGCITVRNGKSSPASVQPGFAQERTLYEKVGATSSDVLSNIASTSTQLYEGVVTTTGAAIDGAGPALASLGEAAAPALQSIGDSSKNLLENVQATTVSVLESTGPALQSGQQTASAALQATGQGVVRQISNFRNMLRRDSTSSV